MEVVCMCRDVSTCLSPICLLPQTRPYPKSSRSSPAHAPSCCFAIGDACKNKGIRRPLCCEGAEEGRDPAGRWCGVHHDREKDPGPGPQSPLPHSVVLLLSDPCKYDSQSPSRGLLSSKVETAICWRFHKVVEQKLWGVETPKIGSFEVPSDFWWPEPMN